MRFIIIVKATADSEAGKLPDGARIASMAAYHQELQKAGVLLDTSRLQPSAQGWRVRYEGGRRTLTEGPFAGTDTLIAGYIVIEVRSRDEAMEWARRFPAPCCGQAAAEIEVREICDADVFGPVEPIPPLRNVEGATH